MYRFAKAALSVVLALAFVAFAGAALAAGKSGKKIKKDQIPAVVAKNYAEAFGKAPIRKCYQEDRDGKTYYRILSKQKHGTATLLYTSGGVLEEMLEPIPDSELPLLVIGSVTNRFPRGKIISCERITHGKTVLYSVTINQLKADYHEVYDAQGAVQKKG